MLWHKGESEFIKKRVTCDVVVNCDDTGEHYVNCKWASCDERDVE